MQLLKKNKSKDQYCWICLFTDQYLIFGAEEGIYTLNLNELHETSMEQVYFWVFLFFFFTFVKKKKKQKQPTTIHGSFWPLINVTYFYIILELTDLFNSMEFPWHVLYEGLYFLLTYFYKIGYLHQALCFSYREVRRSFERMESSF